MSRPAGQVGLRQAAAGALVLVAALTAVVALCRWLLPVATVDAPPPSTAASPCPRPPRPGVAPPAVSSVALIDCPRTYDGTAVTYRGEVVNAVLARDGYAWAQVNDDAYGLLVGPLPEHGTRAGANSGIAVALPTRVAADLVHVGGFRARGDVVEVTGVFRRADPDDGGGPTIRAERARIVARGHRLAHPASGRRVAAAGVLALATAAVAGAAVAARRR